VLGKKRPTCKRQTMNKGISLSLSKCERKVKEMKRRRGQKRNKVHVSNEGTQKEDLEWDLE